MSDFQQKLHHSVIEARRVDSIAVLARREERRDLLTKLIERLGYLDGALEAYDWPSAADQVDYIGPLLRSLQANEEASRGSL